MNTITKLLREIRERGLENTFQRYYSLYQATVTDMDDERQIGRGRVCLESLGYGEAHPGQADVITPYGGDDFGFYFPPYKGDTVYVSFDHGDPSSPMIVGSYWGTGGSKQVTDSEVPAEFVQTDGSAPTVRGIKVRVGSGLAFDESEGSVKVELWTGESQGKGKFATKHHKLTLDDTIGEEKVVVASFGGHSTTWQDKSGEIYVRTVTAGDHELLLDDTNKKILVRSASGHQALLDDTNKTVEIKSAGLHTITINDTQKSITLKTIGQNSITLNDTLKKITGMTAAGRSFSLDDTIQQVQLLSPTPPQSVTMSPSTGTSVADASPSGVSVTALAGPTTITGQGTSMTSAGGGPALTTNSGVSTGVFTGLETKTLQGGSVQTITGVWTLSGPFIASINALFLFFGTGLQVRLVNENFFTLAYNSHFHISGGPGAPTSAPVFGLGIPGTHTTIQTFAS